MAIILTLSPIDTTSLIFIPEGMRLHIPPFYLRPRLRPDRQLTVDSSGTYTTVRRGQVTSPRMASFLHVRNDTAGPSRESAKGYIICLPRAIWIVPIEVGGITPTSVTTAVIFLGGVRSYNGFNISRFVVFSVASDSRGTEIGNVENIPFIGPAGTIDELGGILSDACQMEYRVHFS